MGLSSSTGQAFSQGGFRQWRQIMGASSPFLFLWIHILAIAGLNIPDFSSEQAISQVLQLTHSEGLEINFLPTVQTPYNV
jgi:hypothetical protein